MDASPATWTEFRSDLRASLRAWRRAPALPAMAVLFPLASYLPQPWWWGALPVFLFGAGWLGTERIWYLRIYRDQAIGFSELWLLTWAFVGRFLRLGLLAAIVWSPAFFLANREIGNHPERAGEAFSEPRVWLTSAVLILVTDFVLTFVTPALAFSTRRVGVALRLGVRMLRDHWPHTAWYAVLPPLAVALVFRLNEPSSLREGGLIAVSIGCGLLNLWFKGATAAFYLRRVEVGSQGSAFEQEVP